MNIDFLLVCTVLKCPLSVIRTWTFTMVTAVRYELVLLSQVQDKLAELSHLVQKVWITVKHGLIRFILVITNMGISVKLDLNIMAVVVIQWILSWVCSSDFTALNDLMGAVFMNVGIERHSEHRSQSFTAKSQFCLASSKNIVFHPFCVSICCLIMHSACTFTNKLSTGTARCLLDMIGF